MPEILADYSRRAADAFRASIEASDPIVAKRLHDLGQRLVALIAEREEMIRSAKRD